MRGAAMLVVTILAGIVILDVALDLWRRAAGVRRMRERERDRQRIRDAIDANEARHNPPGWRR